MPIWSVLTLQDLRVSVEDKTLFVRNPRCTPLWYTGVTGVNHRQNTPGGTIWVLLAPYPI
jgi:hypothetical protein